MSHTKLIVLAFCGVIALANAHGSSKTSVSKPHQGKFDYEIDHAKHGGWKGSAHPHGYGGLGDGHGNYGLGGAKAIGILPQGGEGSHHSSGNGGIASHGHGHGHASSSSNFNLHAISHHGGH